MASCLAALDHVMSSTSAAKEVGPLRARSKDWTYTVNRFSRTEAPVRLARPERLLYALCGQTHPSVFNTATFLTFTQIMEKDLSSQTRIE